MKLLPIQQRMWNLREQMKFYAAWGMHKEFAEAKINYAKAFLTNTEAAFAMPGTNKLDAPLFSRTGFNIFKVMICELFRTKSQEEHEMDKVIKQHMLDTRI